MDELVTAQLLTHGKHLYKDIYANHGPLPFMLPHVYASLVNRTDFSYIRWIQPILGVLSWVAVAFSAAIKTTMGRMWAGTLYIFLLSSIWMSEAFNLLLYDTMAGFFFVIIISQFSLPLLFSRNPSISATFVSGLAATCAFFCAYSNIMATALFSLFAFSYAVRPGAPTGARATKVFVLSTLFAILAVGMWLLEYGDPTGYFVYHIYYNLAIHRQYIHYSPADVFRTLSLSVGIVHSLALFLFLAWFLILWTILRKDAPTLRTKNLALLTLLASGVLFTNILGRGPWADSGFVAANLALFSLSTAVAIERCGAGTSRRHFISSAFVSIVSISLTEHVSRSAPPLLGVPQDALKHGGVMKPQDGPIYEFVRSITKPEGDFLSLTYNPSMYIKANRLPASGNLYYEVMKSEYEKRPILGYNIDLCDDIRTHRPAVVWFFNRRAYGTSIDEYKPCVLTLLTKDYTPLRLASPWLIRNDIFAYAVENLPRNADTQTLWDPSFADVVLSDVIHRTVPLSAVAPIPINMTHSGKNERMALRSVEVMLSADGGRNDGDAALHLTGPRDLSFSRRFDLKRIVKDGYYHFDVDPAQYTGGEIRSVTGGGISAWASYAVDDDSYTCVIYEYVDGTRRYTPYCPIM